MQTSFSELEYSRKKKQTRRDRGEIEAVTPWAILEKDGTPVTQAVGVAAVSRSV